MGKVFESRKTLEGMSQYRPPLCFELTGKTFELVMDTGYDYELTFINRKSLCVESNRVSFHTGINRFRFDFVFLCEWFRLYLGFSSLDFILDLGLFCCRFFGFAYSLHQFLRHLFLELLIELIE